MRQRSRANRSRNFHSRLVSGDSKVRMFGLIAKPRKSCAPTITSPATLNRRAVVASLYVGYYATQRNGATYHSPLNCLPGSGWVMSDAGRITISPDAAASFEANRYVIQNGNAARPDDLLVSRARDVRLPASTGQRFTRYSIVCGGVAQTARWFVSWCRWEIRQQKPKRQQLN